MFISVDVHVHGGVARATNINKQEPQTLTLTPSSRNKVVVGELVSN